MHRKIFKLLNISLLGAIMNANAGKISDLDVLIVGAGPAGLSMAKAFQNHDNNPDIIEVKKTFDPEGAGIAIPANATWAMDQLGINFRENAVPISSMMFTDEGKNVLASEDITKIHHEGSQFYAMDRHSLHQSMLNSLQNPKISMNLSVKSFEEKENKVSVIFSDNSTKVYDLVIAADGINSSIRKTIYPDDRNEFMNLYTWRTLTDAPESLNDPVYMMGGDRLFLVYPMNNNKAYLYGHIFEETPQDHSKEDPREKFCEVFKDFGGFVPEVLFNVNQDFQPIYASHLYSNTIHWGESRVLLVGDAGHAFTPMLQNGAAQAIEDAAVMNHLLKDFPGDVDGLLQNFISLRNERVTWTANTSNVRIKAISDPKDIEARNQFIKVNGPPNIRGFKELMAKNPY